MALQSQTYANSGSPYYIRGADPIVPGDQAIIGPVEILPSDTSTTPLYYNRFNQTNATGLSIAEFKTAGNELLSDIILNINNDIILTSQRPGEEAVLNIGVNPAGDAGRVTINANDGLVVKNLAGAGKGLQIYHDGPTNQNRLEVVDTSPAGARMNFNVNTSDITFTNDVTADFMKISPQTNIFQVETPGAGLTAVTPGGVGFIGVGTNGRIGPFGGGSVTLDSSQGVTIRTSSGVAPLPNYNTITANANGTVVFLSTITAPTVNAITGNISTINSSTINNTGNARIASVAVTNDNTASSVPYSTYYGNYQGNLRYNTLRDTQGAPATAIESLEIINVAGGPQTGGIQFYTANNSAPGTVKWMGGFLENNVGAGQSQFVLPASVQASLPNIVNVITINNIPIEDFGTPLGAVLPFAGLSASLPAGFLLCDGSFVSTTTYATLFAVIANQYDYDGIAPLGTFALPDLRQKAPFGASEGSIWNNFTFTVTAQSWDTLTGGTNTAPTNPATGSAYPSLQVVYVSVLSRKSAIFPGMTFSGGAGGQRVITGVINSTSGVTLNETGVVLILDSPLSSTVTSQVCTIFNQPSGLGGMSETVFQNQTIQQPNEVGIHTHQQKQPSQQSTALPGASLKAGNTDENGPNTNNNNNNGTFTINSVTYPRPYSMNNMPSAVFMNYIIKFR
jgi:hypothetical protein